MKTFYAGWAVFQKGSETPIGLFLNGVDADRFIATYENIYSSVELYKSEVKAATCKIEFDLEP